MLKSQHGLQRNMFQIEPTHITDATVFHSVTDVTFVKKQRPVSQVRYSDNEVKL